MVRIKVSAIILPIFLLVGCHEIDNNSKEDQLTKNEVELKMSNEDYDEQYYHALEKDWLSEKDFLYIAEYVINKAKKNDFKEHDEVLGNKEIMHDKEFSDPYKYYYYDFIFSNSKVYVIVKQGKKTGKLNYITISPNGTSAFTLKESNINVLEHLKLRFIGKELPDYSNELAVYKAIDNKFKYSITANRKDVPINSLPKKFYRFSIFVDNFY